MALFYQLEDKNVTDLIIAHAGLGSVKSLVCVNTEFADYMAKRHTEKLMSHIVWCIGSFKYATVRRLLPFLLQHCTKEILNINILRWFVNDGHIDLAQMLIDDGRFPVTNDLFSVVSSNDIQMMRFLLSIPSISPPEDVLVNVCKLGGSDMVQLLLSSPKVEPTGQSLLVSCQKGHLRTVGVLLDDGRIDPDYVLYKVINADNLSLIQLFLDRGLIDCERYLTTIKRMKPGVRDLLKQKRRKL